MKNQQTNISGNSPEFDKSLETVIDIRDLSVGYHWEQGFNPVVRNLNLKIRRNIIFGIAGESGSGKSTLAASIFNSLKYPGEISSGEILFDGVDIRTLKRGPLRRMRAVRFSYIPQAAMNSLNPVKRIAMQFQDILMAHDLDPDQNRDRILEILKMVRLDKNVLNNYPHELSGGMRQRVVISMALLLNPEVVILDEPTTGLDVLVEHDMLKDLKQIQQKLNLTMIFITHDLSILFQIADEIAIMYGGEIVEMGDYHRLLESPANPYTYLLLESIPRIGGRTKRVERMKSGQMDFSVKHSGCMFAPRCPYATTGCTTEHPELKMVSGENQSYRCLRFPAWKSSL